MNAKAPREALEACASRQAGFFTAAQALQAGYSYQGQKYHADHGNWLRAARGIYRLPDYPAETLEDYVRWELWSGGRAVISHGTALAIHDLGLDDPGKTVMTVPACFRATHPAARLVRRDLPADDVERMDGFSVTTVLRTLLDVAADGTTQELADYAVDEALDRGLVTAHDLRWRADELGDRAALRIERALNSAGVT